MTCDEFFKITTTLDPRKSEEVSKGLLAAVVAHGLRCAKCAGNLKQRTREFQANTRAKMGDAAEPYLGKLTGQGVAIVDAAMQDPEVMETIVKAPGDIIDLNKL